MPETATPAPAAGAAAPKPVVDIADSSALASLNDADFASTFGIPTTEAAPAATSVVEPLPDTKGVVDEATEVPESETPNAAAEGEAPLTAEEQAQLAQLSAEVIPEDKLLTPFKIYDAEGELEVPNLEIEFKADGETQKM